MQQAHTALGKINLRYHGETLFSVSHYVQMLSELTALRKLRKGEGSAQGQVGMSWVHW